MPWASGHVLKLHPQGTQADLQLLTKGLSSLPFDDLTARVVFHLVGVLPQRALERTDSMMSSVLGHLEEPKQGVSLIRMAISSPRPSLLATWRVAAANELNGLQSASGLPLMGSMVKYLPL